MLNFQLPAPEHEAVICIAFIVDFTNLYKKDSLWFSKILQENRLRQGQRYQQDN